MFVQQLLFNVDCFHGCILGSFEFSVCTIKGDLHSVIISFSCPFLFFDLAFFQIFMVFFQFFYPNQQLHGQQTFFLGCSEQFLFFCVLGFMASCLKMTTSSSVVFISRAILTSGEQLKNEENFIQKQKSSHLLSSGAQQSIEFCLHLCRFQLPFELSTKEA